MDLDEQQFESGYDENATATPTETPAEVVAETPKEPEPVVDPIKELLARFEKMESSHNTLAGHIGGHNRSLKEIQDRLAAANAATSTVTDAPTKAQVKEAMANPAEWDQLKDEFPEWGSAIEKYTDAKIANLRGPDPAEIERMVNDRIAGQSATVRSEIVNASLEAVYPGWEDEVKSDQFGKWLDAQPDSVKALSQSPKVGDAARMLKLFETSKQAVQKPKDLSAARQKRIEAAVTPRGTGGYAAGPSSDDDFESGYSGK